MAILTIGTGEKLPAQTGEPPFVEQFLVSGKLEDGERQLKAKLAAQPGNDQLLFELGVLQFFQSIEHFGQSLYEFGPDSNIGMGMIPFLRLPVPDNPDPGKVTLDDFRKAIATMASDLQESDATLGKIKNDKINLPLHVFQFHLDFNSDGKTSGDEQLNQILQSYFGIRQRANQELAGIAIDFDRADAQWLQGYCNLLQAMCETLLAYDHTDLWNTIAHRIFPSAVVTHDFFREEVERDKQRDRMMWDPNYIADFIAGIHNCQFKLKEPERLKRAHAHLLTMIDHSRKMWQWINKETDDANEWIPSPNQSNPFANQRITPEMTQSWDVFLDESEALLTGKKLIPFWRGTNPRRGVNLHKVFHEPKDLDLVICIQGPGMIPFLEEGECTQPQVWRQLQRTFRGNFVGFAIWFN